MLCAVAGFVISKIKATIFGLCSCCFVCYLRLENQSIDRFPYLGWLGHTICGFYFEIKFSFSFSHQFSLFLLNVFFSFNFRWSRYNCLLGQLLHSHHYVCLLYAGSYGSQSSEIFVVEEVPYHSANCKCFVFFIGNQLFCRFFLFHAIFHCLFVCHRSNLSLSLFPPSKSNSNQTVPITKSLVSAWPWMLVSSFTCSPHSTLKAIRRRTKRRSPMVMSPKKQLFLNKIRFNSALHRLSYSSILVIF